MGNVTTLTIADGAATPVVRNFDPKRVEPNLVTYMDESPGVFLGYPQLTLGNRLPTQQNGNYKATLRIKWPVLETASTAASGFTPGPTLAYTLTANVDVVIPSRATAEERSHILAILQNSLQELDVESLITSMDLPN